MTASDKGGGRGRPAIHLDGADRQAAYRDRQAHQAALGEAAVFLTTNPTPDFVKVMIGRLLDRASDPAAEKADLTAWLQTR